MFKGLRKLYSKYKVYVRVDLAMYGLFLVLIVVYILYSLLS